MLQCVKGSSGVLWRKSSMTTSSDACKSSDPSPPPFLGLRDEKLVRGAEHHPSSPTLDEASDRLLAKPTLAKNI